MALSSQYTAAFIPLWVVRGDTVAMLQDFLDDQHVNTACASVAQVRRALGVAGLQLTRSDDTVNITTGAIQNTALVSLSDILLHFNAEYVPMGRAARALPWIHELTPDQVKLIAVHAYGALLVAEELSCPIPSNFGT